MYWQIKVLIIHLTNMNLLFSFPDDGPHTISDFLSMFVLKEHEASDFIRNFAGLNVISHKIDWGTENPKDGKRPKSYLDGKELANATKDLIMDINLMASVDINCISEALKQCKEMNKALYKEFKKSMSCYNMKNNDV